MKPPAIIAAGAVSAILASAGVLFPNAVVASASILIVFVVVAGSVVAAVVCRNRIGAAWRGFAVFAVAYFVFAILMEDIYATMNSQLGTAAQPPKTVFISSYFLAWAYDRLGQPEIWTGGGSRVPAIFLLRFSRSAIPDDFIIAEFSAFMTIGQCLATVLVGLIGGWIGGWLYGREIVRPAGEPLARG
ncbi:MAG: hypothetical protein WD468_02305 [Pirellulales bacterium]